MPTYELQNKETGEFSEVVLPIGTITQYLSENPHLKQVYLTPPSIGDSVRMGLKKTPESFRDLLKNIDGRAGAKSTVNYD